MVRTQVQLEPAQYETIRTLAHRERVSLSEMVRRLIQGGLERREAQSATDDGIEALLAIAGIGASEFNDLGRRHDDYLDEDLAT